MRGSVPERQQYMGHSAHAIVDEQIARNATARRSHTSMPPPESSPGCRPCRPGFGNLIGFTAFCFVRWRPRIQHLVAHVRLHGVDGAGDRVALLLRRRKAGSEPTPSAARIIVEGSGTEALAPALVCSKCVAIKLMSKPLTVPSPLASAWMLPVCSQ